jgi:fermentation-respiration switch protein FrsA (DUF1100 family)
MKDKIILIVRLILVAYGTLAAYGWFATDRQIFVPPPSSYPDSPEILKLKTKQGITIAALYLPNPQADGRRPVEDHRTLLYSHGNGEDMGDNRLLFDQLQAKGFAIMAYDYPGYGQSDGKPSEQGAYDAIEAAYDYLVEDLHIEPKTIVLQGRSVGGGPVVDLAVRKPVGGLILESTFVTTFRVVTHIRLLPFDKFDNLAKIPRVTCPVLVIHGTQDRTIPFWHGQALFNAIAAPKQSFWVEGADHNNLVGVAGDRYFQVIQDFVEGSSSNSQ